MRTLTIIALLTIAACGKGGGSSSGPGTPSITMNYKQTWGLAQTGVTSIVVTANCRQGIDCEVAGVIYGNDSGPLPLLKTTFSGTLVWNGLAYSGEIYSEYGGCAHDYTLTMDDSPRAMSLTYNGLTETMTVSEFSGTVASNTTNLAGVPESCVDAR